MGGIKKLLLLHILLTIINSKVVAQNFDAITQSFTAYAEKAIQEKIYVHTDKSFYVAGETMWFKIYQVDAANRPLDISKVVYVELLNADNKPVLQLKLAAEKGMGNGFISLPTSVETGNYIFRAYTAWMQNFGAEFYFQKQITIVNTFKKPDWKKLYRSEQYTLDLFPEGGNLVAGVENRVAFKLVGNNGKGLEARAVLVDSNGDTISRFQTYRFGMGQFTFSPMAGKLYQVVAFLPDGKRMIKDLLQIHERGYTMKLERINRDRLRVNISAQNTNAQQLYLFVHTRQPRQQVKVSKIVVVQNGSAFFDVDISTLGDGISHFTIFDENKQPVCERLYFKHPEKSLSINIKTNKETYLPREKSTIQIKSATDHSPLAANISLAVFRLDSLHQPDEENIATYLWLSSDLAGAIESPAYYFANPQDSTAIDLLMMTHGWRRFEWKEALQNKNQLFNFIPEYEGQIVKGNLLNNNDGLISNASVWFSIVDTNFNFVHSKSDSNGVVSVVLKRITGNNNIIIQSNEIKDWRFNLQSPFSSKYTQLPLRPFYLPEHFSADLTIAHQAMQIQNIYKNDKQSATVGSIDYKPFYGNPDQQYLLDDYTRFPTMEEVLKEFVSEVRVRGQKDKPTFSVLNAPFKTFFELPPLILLDGLPVFDASKVMTIDPINIKKIDVIAQKYFYGSLPCNGIVSFRSYKGDGNGLELDKNAVVIDYAGLQAKRQFYMPLYNTQDAKQSRVPDFRTLLYWAPDVQTGSNGEANLDFFTSDIKGKYAIVVQALSDNGVAGYSIKTFEVKK